MYLAMARVVREPPQDFLQSGNQYITQKRWFDTTNEGRVPVSRRKVF